MAGQAPSRNPRPDFRGNIIPTSVLSLSPMATARRPRLWSLLVCAAVLLPALHVHPAPPARSWMPSAPTTVTTTTSPCLTCALNRECRALPVASRPAPPPEIIAAFPTDLGDAPVLPSLVRTGPLPARGPPAV